MKLRLFIFLLCCLSLMACSKRDTKSASVIDPPENSDPPENKEPEVFVSIEKIQDISSSNASNFKIQGSCSEEGREIIVRVGTVSPSPEPLCSGGSWTAILDVTSLNKQSGSLQVTADHSRSDGKKAPTLTKGITNHFICPIHFVGIPSLSGYTTESFCMAKYEMKQKGDRAISHPEGSPYVNISQNGSILKCKDSGYELVTNDEWQSMARNAEGVPSNWGGGAIGSKGGLNQGHTLTVHVPPRPLAAHSDDNKACWGTRASCNRKVWNNQKRTHTLSNGEVIWDVSGNVFEWVKDRNSVSVRYGDDSPMSQVTLKSHPTKGRLSGGTTTTERTAKDQFGPHGDYTGLSSFPFGGLGYGLLNYNKGVILRGGGLSTGPTEAGLFHASLNEGTAEERVGFRCVYHPKASTEVGHLTPHLNIDIQRINEGEDFSYAIDEGQDVSGLAPGETYTITLSSHGGSGVTYNASTKTFHGNTASLSPGIYTLSGTISDGDGNSQNWSFTLRVRNKTAPSLNISSQNVNEGTSFSYTINESRDVQNLRSGESYTITLSSHGGSGVTYSASTKTFSGNTASLSPGVYTLSGTISDGDGNSQNWSFTLRVQDKTAPSLNISSQNVNEGTSFSYTINESRDVQSLRSGETYTITLSSHGGSGVTYNASTKTFSGSSLALGVYTLSGTISDGDGNSMSWSFALRVQDKTAPSLNISSQSINEGDSFSYTINESRDVQNLRSGETYTITLSSHGGSGVTYNASTKTFSGNTASLSLGVYTLSGTISDGDGNSQNWSFTLRVQDRTAPSLNISSQNVNEGDSFSYTINELRDIQNLRSGETYTITLSSHGGSGVTYNASTKTFSGNTASLSLGVYTLSGTISDEDGNSQNWSFTLRVQDRTAPSLNISSQNVNEGDSFSYTINESRDVQNLRSGETYTITLSSHGGSGVTYSASTKTFSGNTASLSPGVYTLSGTISDGDGNSQNWSFTLRVQDKTAPSLNISSQNVNEGTSFSYTVNESRDVQNLRSGESYTITLSSHGGSGVTYSASTKTFSGSSLALGVYTLRGTISDGDGNSQNWSFTLKVQDKTAPSLNISSQNVNKGNSFSYTINESRDVQNLRSGETYTITLSSHGGSGVTYSASTKTFSGNTASLSPRVYTLSGTISDGDGNSQNWSFTLNVAELRAPTNLETTSLETTSGDHQVTLSWKVPSHTGTSAITHYEYQYSTTSGVFDENTWTLAPGAGSARQVTVSGLTGATTYFFRVRAVNAQGAGIPSDASLTLHDGINLETVCSDSATTDSALPGKGTVDNPFALCSPAHLSLIGDTETDATYTLSANYVMGQDIDLNNKFFTPIAGVFTGTLDGRDKKIMNLKIKVSGHGALFVELGAGGSIKNLGIEEFDVTGSKRVGSLVATSFGTITNCYAVDSDEATDLSGGDDKGSVGGLVGYQYSGSITSSYATGNPEGGAKSDDIGGLVGQQKGGSITSSYATGSPKGGSGNDFVGGLVGYQKGGSIISSYAIGNPHGGEGAYESIGGLVGAQYGGSITSSYATGNPEAGSGDDDVGGLVGGQHGGRVISSYATGNPNGGGGNDDVGGLLGRSHREVISSYATGNPNGGEGVNDDVGGLVGSQYSGGSITSSYATGNPNGGEGVNDLVGGLVGSKDGGTITSSYGFGTVVNGETLNTHGASPSGVTSASGLTQDNSGGSSDANKWSNDAWDFGTSSQAPALKYVDSLNSGSTTAYTCTSNTAFLPSIDITCSTTLLPKQPGRLCIDSTDSVLSGTGTVNDPFVLCSPTHLSLIGDTETDATYTLSANYVMGQDIDLHNEPFTPIAKSFTGILDGRDKKIMNLKINVSGHGALFVELGVGGSIKNLGIEEFDVTGSERVGSLVATSFGTITNCYAVDSDEFTDLSGGANPGYVGGLVGRQDGGSITSSYATGNPEGGESDDSVGGLVGYQYSGSITSSYATGNPEGGGGNDEVGGLVGKLLFGSSITSSYATGNPEGGESDDSVGGLVGLQNRGSITSSYATGNPHGGKGNYDYVGGLVGSQYSGGSITSSYATGNPNGGGGTNSPVGGLLGFQSSGSITSSYATGNPGGGKFMGSLLGYQYSDSSSITSSYGFGTVVNGETSNTHGALPSDFTSASGLTQANSGSSDTNKWSNDAWDFGTSSQAPALKYIDGYVLGDHDNDASTAEAYAYICTPKTAFLPSIDITCGTTLLPKQPGRLCTDSTDSVLSGTGTVSDPFVLCSPAHLRLIGTGAPYTLSANYVMDQDIDLNNKSFTPIAGSFTGTLDGRDKKIMNLKINASGRGASGHGALFVELGVGGSIKNLGIEEFDVTGSKRVGSLVATSSGTITNCYAVDSDEATDVSGGSNYGNYVGGLVGRQDGGSVISSYATGNPKGGHGDDYVGGLVGYQVNGSIISSYATGNPGGGKNTDAVGGLVGYQKSGSITSSYATGSPDGGEGGEDNDFVGGLVGYQNSGSITSSYGFGTTVNGENPNTHGAPPSDVTSASGLTQANSGSSDTNKWSNDAWDFGTTSQAPALKYIGGYVLGDHDDNGDTAETYDYICTPKTAFWPPVDVICGTTLLPNQR